jgi:tol-pal system protein YbgF
MSQLREDNRRLTSQVADLRADRRTQDRKIKDLEHDLAKEKLAPAADVPRLPVEVVVPPSSPAPAAPPGVRVVGVTDDGSEVIYEGDAATGKPVTLDDVSPRRGASHVVRELPPSTDRLEVTHRAARPRPLRHRDSGPLPEAAATDSRAAADNRAAADYRAAVELVRSGKPDDGIAALHRFLKQFPHHEFADHAQYWLGEAFYAQKDFVHALTEFRATIEIYPRGNKVPDALLKVGYCYQALGQADKARATLEQVVRIYPKSEPAALAAKRLETP